MKKLYKVRSSYVYFNGQQEFPIKAGETILLTEKEARTQIWKLELVGGGNVKQTETEQSLVPATSESSNSATPTIQRISG